jgi:HSP20 family molecular chaperone IbpA
MPAGPQDQPGRRLRDDEGDRTVMPVTDVFETATGFTIVADMPGVAPDRLEVTAEREALTIRGRVIRPSQPPRHREFDLADYAQTFTLTEDLDATRIRASLKDGVLRITIPRSATVQPRRIEIQND